MKRILPLIALTLVFSPRAAFPQNPCPVMRIEDCPSAGCVAWDSQLNIRKNVASDPSQRSARVMTLQEIRQLPYPREWNRGKDRRELDALGEGQLVEVTAFLIDVKDGEISSANCKLVEVRTVNNIKTVTSVNDLLVLVSRETLNKPPGRQREAESVVAEITPRVRAAHSAFREENQITNWTAKKLRLLINQSDKKAVLVKVTGLLLFDTEASKPLIRYTDWEIHPIFEIAVCRRPDGCPNDADWQKLERVIIKQAHVPIRSRIKPRFKRRGARVG